MLSSVSVFVSVSHHPCDKCSGALKRHVAQYALHLFCITVQGERFLEEKGDRGGRGVSQNTGEREK